MIIYYVVLTPSFFALVFSGWLAWQSNSLEAEIKNAPADSLTKSIDYPILVVEPIKNFLIKASSETTVDFDVLFESLRIYLDRNPLDADAWLVGSKIYQQYGDEKLASLYLSVAHSLSESNIPVLLKVFNRYLELNLIDQAMPVARDIAVANPKQFRRLFYLMSRLSDDYVSVVDKVIPKQLMDQSLIEQNLNSIKNVYFQWAMLDAIRAGNAELAKEVWSVIPGNERLNNIVGIKYLNYLSQFQNLSILKPVWIDVVGTTLVNGELLNYAGEEQSPCWYVIPTTDVDASLDNIDNDVEIKINFLGETNVNFNHLRCLVSVNPKNKYRLTGRYKGKNISTLSGPYIDLYFPGVKKVVGRTEKIVGSSPWLNYQVDFDVPEDINFVEIRVRRRATDLLDSKISGTVWFDSFKLSLIE